MLKYKFIAYNTQWAESGERAILRRPEYGFREIITNGAYEFRDIIANGAGKKRI